MQVPTMKKSFPGFVRSIFAIPFGDLKILNAVFLERYGCTSPSNIFRKIYLNNHRVTIIDVATASARSFGGPVAKTLSKGLSFGFRRTTTRLYVGTFFFANSKLTDLFFRAATNNLRCNGITYSTISLWRSARRRRCNIINSSRCAIMISSALGGSGEMSVAKAKGRNGIHVYK